ncbi:hypothetical protein VHUM_01812 [Vanrija humicola]|uniref:Calpain catalytic domain-containing protein n=1 Tax=Vanrija humicola TaxID=5417 RepID=A0A7D8Z4B2_VANHU|nr:hypothetical protein VHUM_01812 [Vanrija humicola]
MAFNTYNEGLKIATSLASRAIAVEASLSQLSTSASPVPTLLKAFQLYIQAAESYSHLLSSSLVAKEDRTQVSRKWRLVLERAEKVKRRVEELGGRVGSTEIDDEAEEAAVIRRGSRINGANAEVWRGPPPDREFTLSAKEGVFRDGLQPELAVEQLALDPEWAELPASAWEDVEASTSWAVRQGPGADCSITAGLGSSLAHNTRWGTKLCESVLYPQAVSGRPVQSENAMHVVRLLLNGTWRSVAKKDQKPLYITAQPANSSPADTPASPGPAWIPLAVKGYFKTLGGYSIPGSDPAPDVYAFTGWIPERLNLNTGFQREKEWTRLVAAWKKGSVIVTLGSGKDSSTGLVPLHAYGVIDVRDDGGERTLEIFDPGSANIDPQAQRDLAERLSELQINGGESNHVSKFSFSMAWDEVCSRFETLNINWDPALVPATATRHWSWPKSDASEHEVSDTIALNASPRYRLTATASEPDAEVWLLLSQHHISKDIPLDDVALHVFRDFNPFDDRGRRLSHSHHEKNPYVNALHTLVRFPLRQGENTLNAVASRDRGLVQRGFTLRAFASPGTSLVLKRVTLTLPFSETVNSELTKRTAGGHPGFPSHHTNPQYRLSVGQRAPGAPPRPSTVRIALQGAKELAWNIKLLWGHGQRVFEMTSDVILGSSGPFSYGVAYCEVDNVKAGDYTLLVSSYERDQLGSFTFTVESSSPVQVTPIPQEGAGMYSRAVSGNW